MAYVTVMGEYYEETDTIVVDRTQLTDEFNLSFNPSEYVTAYFKELTSLYKRVVTLTDRVDNVIFWKYQSEDTDAVKNLIVFNH